MEKGYLLGIDIGNTKLAFGLVQENTHSFQEKRVVPTEPELGAEQAVEKIMANTRELLKAVPGKVKGIGIAFGGFVDTTRRIALASPNFPGFRNVPLVSLIEGLAPGIPVFMDNDANAAGVGEVVYGKGQGCSQVLYLTISTGIGGAALYDGVPLAGTQGLAGEFGHMIVLPNGPRCTCGGRGCLESVASGTSIGRIARERAQGRATMMTSLAGGIDKITAQTVSQAARQGDRLALEILDEVGFYLGIGLANLISAFDPDIVILGGGVMNSADLLLPRAVRFVEEHLTPRGVQVPPIEVSSIHNDIALWGAIALAGCFYIVD
ncbi:MAG: ROK family protein [Firmicutes bacterium]|nr:ROK family protein [Bacillota bacterium]